jgi:hypothetical protein
MVMATFTTCHLPPLLPGHHLNLHPSPPPFTRHLRPPPPIRPLRAARRRHPDAVVVVPDARPWVGDLSGAASYRDGSEEDGDEAGSEDEDEDDRSLDLLARFLHSVFRKASRRARRAARSVLPPSVPAELVRFAACLSASLYCVCSELEGIYIYMEISLGIGRDLGVVVCLRVQVKFSINGVLALTFLWILKGLLEVRNPF